MNKSNLSAYDGKRLRFWTSDEHQEVQRVGTLSTTKEGFRLQWEETVPGRAVIKYYRILDPRIVSVLDPAPDGSGADFDCIEVLAVRRPHK